MTWDKKPNEFTVIVKKDVALVRNKAAAIGLRGLIFRTPVKTGTARRAWTTSVGQIANENRGPGPKNAALGIGMRAIVASINRPYDVIYISNNIDYIGVLDAGRRMAPNHKGTMRWYGSDQAPNGFMDIVFNDLRVRFG